MNSPIVADCSFEFYFDRLDTLVLVETRDETVVIRATRDTFSERRKEFFIRELAAEGFIPDECRWFSPAGGEVAGHVRWLVDFSWLQPDEALAAQTRRFMLRLLSSATLLWLLLLGFLFWR
jgi:hypothetical protein